ncbi:Inositol 1,4,5-trisphosphate receptor-interacting protein [Merluccius polli]|uniref:Inositol 1,4,5-trisphosphate receptor-interacting protein n=1 Tax=Merluccius polli TaxID=89951 RepID=A0AA47NCU8_MERPO|nr:Inositol 1,4,5-trisphosphate receptor-interacting protein [Merluccius polli]
MQGPLLRVLAVTLGLILYPREEPGVEDWADTVTEGMEEHEGLLNEARKLHTEIPFNHRVPQTVSDAKAQVNLEVTSESTTSSNSTDTFLSSKDLSASVYPEGKEENEHVESKDSGKSHSIAEPDADQPQEVEVEPDAHRRHKTSPADHTEEPAVPRRDEHLKPHRVPSHRVADGNGAHVQTSGASTDPRRRSAAVPWRSNHLQRDSVAREQDKDYLWFIWNTFSAISLVRFLRKYLKHYSLKQCVKDWMQSNPTAPVEGISGRVPLPDSNTLHLFHARFVKVSRAKMWRTGAFLEDFTHDLLEVMRTTSGEGAGVVMEDLIQTESGCDIVVPLVPPEPYGFQCRLWSTSEDGMQGCCKINMVERTERQNGCDCDSSDTQDDMVCLLHRRVEQPTKKHSTDVYGLLCVNNTTFLSKAKVTKWFKGTIRKAWEQISHKYEFELSFSKTDTPVWLAVRFRSGRKVHFTLNPVIQLCNTAAYCATTPCAANVEDISWTVSLTSYEDNFLKHVCKTLPEHACHRQVLDILSFLHQKQTALTGSSALEDFHFKNALMELLLSTEPSQWHPKDINRRLRDLVVLMETSLCQRLLHHALIGNPSAQHIELPAELSQARRVNLFRPLVVQDCNYTKTLRHFQEILRNAFILIQDYTSAGDSLEIKSKAKKS